MEPIIKCLINQGNTSKEAQDIYNEITEQANKMLDDNTNNIGDYYQLLADYGLEPDYLMDLFG